MNWSSESLNRTSVNLNNVCASITMLIALALVVLLSGNDCCGQSRIAVLSNQTPETVRYTSGRASYSSVLNRQPVAGDSYQQPYVLILPGILGEQFWDRNVYNGLVDSGLPGHIEIYDWTQGPLAMPTNMGGDDQQTDYLAHRILQFKQEFPKRPLYLIGHSGGCRMAVKVLERLSSHSKTNVPVEKALLLSPCMNSSYDLRAAMLGTYSGIIAFCSPLDLPISLPLTLAHGVTKGDVSMSAAIVGFQMPYGLARHEQETYRLKLQQRKYQLKMMRTGHVGGHFGWTNPKFVASYVAPLIR